jgi:hypothetical protein
MQTWGFGQREEGLKYMGKYQTKILERDATKIPFPGGYEEMEPLRG